MNGHFILKKKNKNAKKHEGKKYPKKMEKNR